MLLFHPNHLCHCVLLLLNNFHNVLISGRAAKSFILEITNTFANYLEPEVYAKLNELIEAEYFNALLKLNLSKAHYDNKEKLAGLDYDTRPTLKNWRGSPCRFKTKDYETILYLYNWCAKYYYEYWHVKGDELINQKYKNFKYVSTLKYNGGEKPALVTQTRPGSRSPHL